MHIRRLSSQDVQDLAFRAACAAGFNAATAQPLAEATMEAELHGKSAVGLSHLFDYFVAIEPQLINCAPSVTHRAITPTLLVADADDGPMQYAFSASKSQFVDAVHSNGLAMLTITDAFAGGELGYYARSLAREGILSINAVNSPAVMSFGGSKDQLLGTNPLCYGIPLANGHGIVVDQASSNTALVSVQQLAAQGAELPDNWAVDALGQMTTDPTAALAGALLPFGGYKGGNIAMLVELLALLGGATPSVEAASYYRGEGPPKIGGTFIGIDLTKFPGYPERIAALLQSFKNDYHSDVRIIRDLSNHDQTIEVADQVIEDLTAFIVSNGTGT